MVDEANTMEEVETEAMSARHWRRVAKLAIVELLFKFLWRLLKENWALFAPLAIYVGTFKSNSFAYLAIGALLVFVSVIIYAFMYYLSFEYCVDEEGKQILLKRGVFVNDRITLAFSRVQNINQKQPFYFRPFQLVNIAFDSAGSSGKEITLPGITYTDAQEILRKLKAYSNSSPTIVEHQGVPTESEQTASTSQNFELGLGQLIRFGLSNQSVLVYVLAGLVPLLQVMGIEMSEVYGAFVAWLSAGFEHPDLHRDSLILKLIFLILVFICCQLAVIVYSILRYWRFCLSASEENLEKSSGLTEKQQISVKKRKVQALLIYQNAIAHWLGFYRVRFLQVNQQFGSDQHQPFILPYLAKKRWKNLGQTVFSRTIGEIDDSAKPGYQLLLRYVMVFAVLPSIAIAVNAHLRPYPEGLYLLAPVFLMLLLFYRRYRSWVIQERGEFTLVRSSWIGDQLILFTNKKIQSLSLSQSYLQRKAGLCHLTIQLSAKRLRVPYLSYSWASRYVDQRLWELESKNDTWC